MILKSTTQEILPYYYMERGSKYICCGFEGLGHIQICCNVMFYISALES